MSNRVRRRPPTTVRRLARSYRCLDCPADIGPPRQDTRGIWHLPVRHEPSCPMLTGAVIPATALLTAAASIGDDQ